jgi:hypothetical protein
MPFPKILNKNIKISPIFHKDLKILSVKFECRIDFLASFAISQFLKKQELLSFEDQEEYKIAKKEFEKEFEKK